jgi:hypothetical protein
MDYALEESRILKEEFRAATGKERIPIAPDPRQAAIRAPMEGRSRVDA